MVGIGSYELVTLLGLAFGLGLPLGTPPLPEDPMMAKIAPAECLAYVSSAGMATPGATSGNQTEQLLAEPEVRQMAKQVEKAIRAGLQRAMSRGDLPPGASSDDVADLAKLLLTRPLAVYVSSVRMQPGGPMFRGGMAINLGEDAAKIKAKIAPFVGAMPAQHVKEIEIDGEPWQSFTPLPRVTISWGFHDSYFFVAVGEGEAEAMLRRAEGDPPKWLVQLRDQLPVERLSTVAYFNIKAIVDVAVPMAGPRAAKPLQALGLGNLTTLASVAGLDEKGYVNKTLLGIDGEPEGLLRLANIEPLAQADLTPIPRDATFAVAFKLDPETLFDTIQEIVGKIDPRAKVEMLRAMGELQASFGLKVPDELLKPLGDTWCIFDSPSEGGILSGLTMVVSLKDAKQAIATQARLASQLAQRKAVGLPRGADPRIVEQWGKWTRRPGIDIVEFAGKQIYVVNSDGKSGSVVAPSWCVTDRELIVALFPQSIKAYLSRPADFESLAESPDVAKAFQGDGGPIKITYCDSRRVFDLLYPVVLATTTTVRGQLRWEGIDLGAALLPSARAIRGHLSPAVATVRRTKAGIEIIERHTLPSAGMAIAVPVGIGMLMPAVCASREAARRMSSISQMKMISLAMHNYAQAHRTFPPAYKADKDGKPLLS